MKAKDIFKLVVRILGLIVLLYGLWSLLEGVLCALGLANPEYGLAKYWAVRGVVEIIFGLFMMRGVIPLTELAFPDANPSHRGLGGEG